MKYILLVWDDSKVVEREVFHNIHNGMKAFELYHSMGLELSADVIP